MAIVAVQRARSLRDPAKLDAWLHKVAVRKAIDETRKRPRRRTVELQEQHDFPADEQHGTQPTRSRCSPPFPHASAPR